MWEPNEVKPVYPELPDTKYQADPLRDGVIVPLAQAVITGVMAGIVAGGIWALARWPFSPWLVGLIAGSGVMFFSWLAYRSNWQMVFESITGADLNKDGYIGPPPVVVQPPKEPEKIRIEVIQDEGKAGDWIDLPYPEKLPELSRGLLEGKRQFSQTTWSGRGHLFSRAEFETLRGELIRRGLARWKNPEAPSQGVELTPAGKAVLRRLAEGYNRDSPTAPS